RPHLSPACPAHTASRVLSALAGRRSRRTAFEVSARRRPRTTPLPPGDRSRPKRVRYVHALCAARVTERAPRRAKGAQSPPRGAHPRATGHRPAGPPPPPIFTPVPVGPPSSTRTGASDACAWRVNFARNGPPRAPLFTRVYSAPVASTSVASGAHASSEPSLR